MDKTYNQLFTIDLNSLPNSIKPQPRALSFNSSKNKLYVGTNGCELVEVPIDLAAKSAQEGVVLTHGHYAPGKPTNEVWGLCTDPTAKNLVVTCSDDATIRVWDTKEHKQVACIPLDAPSFGREFPYETQGKNTEVKDAVNG